MISSYECDYMITNAEFLLSKSKYKAATGREQRWDADVLRYQICQVFKQGEITPGGSKSSGIRNGDAKNKGQVRFVRRNSYRLPAHSYHQQTFSDSLKILL